MLPSKDQSFNTSAKYCFAIEFYPDEHNRHGFPASQLMHYSLGENPDGADDKNEPPQKLTLAFLTADVVILGWRLGHIVNKLQENELASVQVLAKRYSELDKKMPFVASIKITPVEKQ
jgi:hypothetical protein